MKKKVLVIGANGFTGRRILNDLSRNDEYIVTGCSLHDDIAPDSGNYRFISADICQMGEQSALFREVRPNIVIRHRLAASCLNLRKDNPSYLFKPSLVPSHMNPFRSCRIALTVFCDKPFRILRFLK